ncbi:MULTISPECIES: alpha/beta fold hydrolase [unclassified Crossiella]|uniref:alpha/beta fold hydrolase n=1 Tax=unclassified Crossiella TaxID=2620835 RepID=UPI001FFE478A|nr:MULTISPECIES: alpha/beta hydrolase [unclassified Crossiella]MCK2237009.1 alpha/beta hydrolase [Crossiella sp. S99.2]MCK2250677.1 alpha/beta hydrolase [Crossiella sp. S99.1]
MKDVEAGELPGGFPYLAVGSGRPLVYLPGFTPEHVNPAGLPARMAIRSVRPLAEGGWRVHLVNRRPGLRRGMSMAEIAAEHAAAITARFGEPVALVGHSTGGTVALQLTADHPAVVSRVVLASTAYTLGPVARKAQWAMAHRLAERRPGYHLLADGFTRNPVLLRVLRGLMWTVGNFGPWPLNPVDMLAMIEAEDRVDLRARLPEIATPALVVAGARDYFWTPELFTETADLLPNGRLVLYPDAGHAVNVSRRFYRDALAFLAEGNASR